MKVLVTGATGFVGRWVVERLLEDDHEVTGTTLPSEAVDAPWARGVSAWQALELTDDESVSGLVREPYDWVVHLAAMASGSECRSDPGRAWAVNAVGTARLTQALADAATEWGHDPLLLLASTSDLYGVGEPRPRREDDAVAPLSPYSVSKAAGELAALEVGRRAGLRVVVARAFPHTGPGQDPRFVAPAFARRLMDAKAAGTDTVRVGGMDVVRELLHVRDVAEAYVALLERGESGEVYNVCRGIGISLRELFDRLASLIGHHATPRVDQELVRSGDIAHLVGDPSKIHRVTGWVARTPLDRTLADLIDAQKP